MGKKTDKELKKLNQIGDGVAMIEESLKSIEHLASQYDSWIDEAAELGEDEYSDQLIAEKVEMEEFARILEALKVKVRANAVTANTFNGFQKLPAAMDACKSLLNAGPNLKKLGKQMASFKSSMEKATTTLKDLRSELIASKDPVYNDLFGKKTADDPDIAKKIAAEKAAREARLAAKVSSTIPSPIAGEAFATDIDAITAMIEEENKKK